MVIYMCTRVSIFASTSTTFLLDVRIVPTLCYILFNVLLFIGKQCTRNTKQIRFPISLVRPKFDYDICQMSDRPKISENVFVSYFLYEICPRSANPFISLK